MPRTYLELSPKILIHAMNKIIFFWIAILSLIGCQNAAVSQEKPLDMGKGQWRKGPALQTERTEVSAAVLGGKIYVIGGFQKGIGTSTTVEVFDPQTGQWSLSKPLPLALDHTAAVVVGNKLYVIGGYRTGWQPSNSVLAYDPATDTWETKTYSEHEVYDPATNTWARRSSLPIPRHGLAAVTFQDQIYVLSGGPKPGGSYSNANEIFLER